MQEYKKCEFDEILDDMIYDHSHEEDVYRNPRYEKLKGVGYAIGQCTKFSGKYRDDHSDNSYGECEQDGFIGMEKITFIKILIFFNKVVLVEKNHVRYIDEKTNDTL